MTKVGTVCARTIQVEGRIEWKINNFLRLEAHKTYSSPEYNFSGGSGYFEIELCSNKRDALFEYADIYLQLTSGHEDSTISSRDTATFSLKTMNGKSYLERTGILYERNSTFSVPGFILRSDLIKNKSKLLPSGALTIISILNSSEPSAVSERQFLEATSQTEEAGGYKSQLPAANPCNKTLVDLKELFLKQEDCDVVLKVRDREFSAHRVILGARSSVFASAFRSDMKEKATGVVEIEDCDPSTFSDFLCFLYCGNSEDISTTNVFSLFVAADKYDVQDLRSECLKFMENNLSVDTFCDTIALALQHSEKTLTDLATDFFAKNLQEIIKTVKWQAFLHENTIHGNELLIKALSNKKIV